MEENEEQSGNEALTPSEKVVSDKVINEIHVGVLALLQDEHAPLYKRVEQFRTFIDKEPRKELIKLHPYMRGVKYIPISHVEGMLDTLFFRQWGTRNFRYQLIGNEMVGEIELWYIDPITQREIVRVGAAGAQIMVDRLSKEQREVMTSVDINRYSLDLSSNKKPNALEMGFPSFKAQCFKNAARTVGKLFGKDLNRDVSHAPVQIIPQNFEAVQKLMKKEGKDA